MNTTGKKYGGRKKGTPNKSTAEIRQALANFLSGKIDELESIYESLTPKGKADFIIKAMPYIVPRLTEEITHEPERETKGTPVDLSILTSEELHFLYGIYDKIGDGKTLYFT